MATLETVLGDELQITVLRWLSWVRQPMSGNAVARQLGLPQSSVRKALERLVTTGVVTRTDVGRSAAYTLNEQLTLVRSLVVPLFRREERVLESAIEELAGLARWLLAKTRDRKTPRRQHFVSLYGSLAIRRRDFRDVDLLVVTTSAQSNDQVHDLLATKVPALQRRLGVPIRIVVIPAADLNKGHASDLVASVRDTGLALAGVPPAQLATIRVHRPPTAGAA